jgi:hypothetical protein
MLLSAHGSLLLIQNKNFPNLILDQFFGGQVNILEGDVTRTDHLIQSYTPVDDLTSNGSVNVCAPRPNTNEPQKNPEGKVYQGPYTIVQTEIPPNIITPIMLLSVDRRDTGCRCADGIIATIDASKAIDLCTTSTRAVEYEREATHHCFGAILRESRRRSRPLDSTRSLSMSLGVRRREI